MESTHAYSWGLAVMPSMIMLILIVIGTFSVSAGQYVLFLNAQLKCAEVTPCRHISRTHGACEGGFWEGGCLHGQVPID